MQVIGNIGSPVEKARSRNGRDYFRFRLAENHNSRPKPGAAGSTSSEASSVPATWYYVNAFIDEESANLLAKGTFVCVTGRLEASPYLNKENQPAVRLTIMAGKVEPMRRKEQSKDEPEGHDYA